MPFPAPELAPAAPRQRKDGVTHMSTEKTESSTVLRWPGVIELAQRGNVPPPRRVEKSDAEWRKQLTNEEYHVARGKGTERPFSSEMCALFEPGRYNCICCGTPLFESDTKFDSGCGWPSYFRPLNPENVREKRDTSHGMIRTEVICNVCDAHLGHVFPDGPPPTGLRYCFNSASLSFEPA